jgi:hypothetical protein
MRLIRAFRNAGQNRGESPPPYKGKKPARHDEDANAKQGRNNTSQHQKFNGHKNSDED